MNAAEQNQLGLEGFSNFIKFQYFNVTEQKPARPFSWVDCQHFTYVKQCQLGFSLVGQNTNMLNLAEQSQPGRYIGQNTNVLFRLVMLPTFLFRRAKSAQLFIGSFSILDKTPIRRMGRAKSARPLHCAKHQCFS